MGNSSLGHVPSGQRWEFDTSVTTVFDDMLRRSIPQYEVMRHAVTELAKRHPRSRLLARRGFGATGGLLRR